MKLNIQRVQSIHNHTGCGKYLTKSATFKQMIINGVFLTLTVAKLANAAKVNLSAHTSKCNSHFGLSQGYLLIRLTICLGPIVVKDDIDLTMLLLKAGFLFPHDLH